MKNILRQRRGLYFLISALFLGMVLPGSAYAAEYVPKAVQIAQMSAAAIKIAMLLGAILFATGLWGFYKSAENKAQYPFSNNIAKVVAGTCLLSIYLAYDAAASTLSENMSLAGPARSLLSNNPNIAALSQSTTVNLEKVSGITNNLGIPDASFGTLIMFIFFFGLISFIRGLYTFSKVGENNNNDSSIWPAITYVFGGVAAMNIIETSCIISSFLQTGKLCLVG